MVDIGAKAIARREAIAAGKVQIGSEALRLIKSGKTPKGDVFAAARIAGILAAKKTHELIPLCHPLKIDLIEISFWIVAGGVWIRSRVKSEGKTGVEMEALTAASVAALTIYDMCKSADKGISIGPIFLVQKSGGKSGFFKRSGMPNGRPRDFARDTWKSRKPNWRKSQWA